MCYNDRLMKNRGYVMANEKKWNSYPNKTRAVVLIILALVLFPLFVYYPDKALILLPVFLFVVYLSISGLVQTKIPEPVISDTVPKELEQKYIDKNDIK